MAADGYSSLQHGGFVHCGSVSTNSRQPSQHTLAKLPVHMSKMEASEGVPIHASKYLFFWPRRPIMQNRLKTAPVSSQATHNVRGFLLNLRTKPTLIPTIAGLHCRNVSMHTEVNSVGSLCPYAFYFIKNCCVSSCLCGSGVSRDNYFQVAWPGLFTVAKRSIQR